MAIYKRQKKGFTLTELAVAIILLLVVGVFVSKEAVSVTQKRADVEKVKETYTLIEKATNAWQAENFCPNDVTVCIEDAKRSGVRSPYMFNGIAKYLPVVAATVNVDAKGRTVEAESFSKVEWLPESTLTFDGGFQRTSTMGVSKFKDENTPNMAYYLLRNGVTIAVNMPENNGNTGYGFFDINGKEGANQIGVDVFPFSLGADIDSSNPVFKNAAKKVNPYFSSTNIERLTEICNINTNLCASDKVITNPTAYVLYTSRLPE